MLTTINVVRAHQPGYGSIHFAHFVSIKVDAEMDINLFYGKLAKVAKQQHPLNLINGKG